MPVKIFKNKDLEELEKDINTWLKENRNNLFRTGVFDNLIFHDDMWVCLLAYEVK